MKAKMENIFILISIFAIITAAEKNPGRLKRSADTCGVAIGTTALISKGQNFTRGDFPWIVALMDATIKPVEYFCGGTLISSTFVISGK